MRLHFSDGEVVALDGAALRRDTRAALARHSLERAMSDDVFAGVAGWWEDGGSAPRMWPFDEEAGAEPRRTRRRRGLAFRRPSGL